MRIVYFDFGHARIQYGSAASLISRGHEVHFVESTASPTSGATAIMDVEIGVDGATERLALSIIRMCPKSLVGGIVPKIDSSTRQPFELVVETDPDLLITGTSFWVIARKIARNLGIPLVLWKPVTPAVFKILVFARSGRRFSNAFSAPLGLIYDGISARLSTYTITNDRMTSEMFRRMGIGNVETVWPTYTRFAEENAYSRYMKDGKTGPMPTDLPTRYVLSVIPLQRGSRQYYIESKAMRLLRFMAERMPHIDFVVVGSSRSDLENLSEYVDLGNLFCLGKIYDDSCLAKLYRQARCVVCPVYIPGFSNRLLEAFFYQKAIVSTPIVAEYYDGLRHGSNILMAGDKMATCESVELVVSESRIRHNLESGAHQYYLRYFHPEKHASAIEKIAFQISDKGVPTC